MRHHSLRVLFLSCFLGLTAGSGLLPLSSIQIAAQSAELSSQGSQDGVIKACTGQSINLGAPQLTGADLKVLTGCSSGVIPQLLEALKSRDWKVKVIAAHTLGLYGKQAQSVIPELNSLMLDENADVRFAVAQALGDIGTEAVVPVLARALQDKDENVRVSAADAFLKIGAVAKEAKPVLIDALWDGNWYVRSRVATTISELGLDASDLPQMTKNKISILSLPSLFFLLDPSFRNHPNNLPVFLIKASQHTDSEIRRSAALALSKFYGSAQVHSGTVTNKLLELLRDQNSKVRSIAAKGLNRRLQNIELNYRVESALVNATKDPDPSVRQAAIHSLEWFYSPEVIHALLTALQDRDPYVRRSVVNSLTRMLEKLREDYKNTIPNVLRDRLSKRVYSGLINSLSDEDEGVRQEVISSLITMRPAVSNYVIHPTLIEILRKREVGVEFRRSLILALGDQTEYSLKGLSESAEITNLLTEALQDSDPGIRQQAVIILSKIGKLEKRLDSASVVNLFVEGLHSENPSVLLDAINGLNQFCSKNSKPYKHTSTCPEAKNALPLLINLLKEDIKPLKYAAAFAIIRIKPDQEDVIKVFQEILLEEALSYELSNNAFGALLNIGSPNAIAAIIKSLQSSNKALCYFRTCLGFDSRNLSDNFNHNLLLDALRDENRRFSASLFFEDRATHPRKRQDLVGLEQYQKRLSQDVISQLLSILEEKKNEYKDFPLLKSIFKLKNQDIRRSVVYILGNPSLKGKSYIVNALMQILSDQGEDLNLRWMAATSLQELDMNVDWFFREKQLLNPKSYQCPNPDGRPRLTPEFNFDIYLSQCIYRYGACGAGLSEVYRALMDLLNQSKK